MKQIGFIIVVTIFLISCNHSTGSMISKTDTAIVVYRLKETQNWQLARGIYRIGKKIKVEDSVAEKTSWSMDTVFMYAYITNQKDTAKDATGKNIYDSASHSYRLNMWWYPLTEEEKNKIEIKVLPK